MKNVFEKIEDLDSKAPSSKEKRGMVTSHRNSTLPEFAFLSPFFILKKPIRMLSLSERLNSDKHFAMRMINKTWASSNSWRVRMKFFN